MSWRSTLAASVALATSLSAGTVAGAADWTTYHHDGTRTGVDSADPAFASAAVSHTSPSLSGAIYGEPLVSGTTVYVATEANIVYALDSATLNILWSTGQVDPPAPLGDVQNAAGGLTGCGNINPIGMTGTPVIDPALGSSGTLFVAEETWDGNTSTPHVFHRLVKVDLASHTVTTASVDPPGLPTRAGAGTTNTAQEQQRSALALTAGRVIVTYGGLVGDCGAYHGFAESVNESDLSIAATYQTVPSFTGAGLWAAGGGAVDGSGNIYLASGNGGDNSGHQDSEAVIKLDPGLNRLDIWSPTDWASLNNTDTDIGSIGPMLLPGNLVFQGGKAGVGYLLHQSALSANANHIGGEAFSAQVCHATADAMFGGAAFVNGVIFVPCSDGLAALQLDATHATFSQLWYDTTAHAQPPIVAGGAVWTVMSGTLYAITPSNDTHRFSVAVSGSGQNQFMTPAAGDGQVFMAGNSGTTGKVTAVSMSLPPPTQVAATVGQDGALWEYDGTNRIFDNLGGRLIASPAATAAVDASGSTPLFVGTGLNHDLWVSGPQGDWAPLTTAPVYCLDSPAVVAHGTRGSGTITVACEGADEGLWYAQGVLPASGLPVLSPASWRSAGGRLSAGPAVLYKPGASNPTFEALGTDGAVWETTLGTPGFTRTTWLCSGHPASATNPGQTVSYFACQGLDGRLWFATATGSTWSPGAPAGGLLVGGPGIAATAGGATFYVEGRDSALWETSLSGGQVGTFRSDGGLIQFGAGGSGL